MFNIFYFVCKIIKDFEEKQIKYTESMRSKEINRFLWNAKNTVKLILILLFYIFLTLLSIVAFTIVIVLMVTHFDEITSEIILHLPF